MSATPNTATTPPTVSTVPIDQIRFEAPGAGRWELDLSHGSGGATPFLEWVMEASMAAGMKRVFAELGVPAETLSIKFVNGFMYTRLRPLIMPDKTATKLPPLPVLKIATRLHPAFRRRAKAATKALAERPWRKVVADWHATIQPELERSNLALQDVDLTTLDEHDLVHHVEDCLNHIRKTAEMHFWLHGYDLGPLGILIFDCKKWGLAPADVFPAMTGASPSTSGPARALAAMRGAVRDHVLAGGTRPATLDELRAVSPAVAEQLDQYLRFKGNLLFSRYDLDGITLNDAPHVVLSTICDGLDHQAATDAGLVAADLRARVPEGERATFDERLSEARAALDLRDNNGPNTFEWPAGLVRRAFLEVGRRLVTNGKAHAPEHTFELGPNEIILLLHDGVGPTADELAGRAARRKAMAKLDPPRSLGPVEPVPPLEVLPPSLQRMVGTVNAVLTQMGMTADLGGELAHGRLKGNGVGKDKYTGRARLATSAEQAINVLEPGDVLVVAFTTPAYNVVLALAGAVITAEGGPMSHAAVLARELGIPAIVGMSGALTDIPDGALVEVDPTTGVLSVLSGAPR